MTKTVELIFDCVSPTAYLIWQPLRYVAARSRAQLTITPVFLGGMHKLTGNAPPFIRDAEVKGKNAYAMLEMQRFIKAHSLTRYRMNSNFPFNSIQLQRLLLVAIDDGKGTEFADLLLRHVWEEDFDASAPDAAAKMMADSPFNAEDMIERIQAPELKQRLIDNTENAVERGAFGIPTMFVGEEMFFGKERLAQIEAALA